MLCSVNGKRTAPKFLSTIFICCICGVNTNNFTYSGNVSKTPAVADVALAVFKRQNLNHAVIFNGQCSTDWSLFRKMLTNIPTSFITPNTLWQLDNTFCRTGILVDLRGCPIAKTMFSQKAVQTYFNSSYRWLLIGETSLQQTTNLLKGYAFRLDTSISAALPRKDSVVLLDLYKSSISDAILDHPVGQFRDNRLFDWIDAENAPFRSKVHRKLPTGLLVSSSATSAPINIVMERFNLIRGHPHVPANYFAMKEFQVYLALCDLYNISVQPHFYTQSGYPDEHGMFSGIMGGLQRREVDISAMKVLMDKHRMMPAEFLISCDACDLDVIYYVGLSLDTPAALLEPFSPGLWIAVFFACALLTGSLWYMGVWEMRCERAEGESVARSTTVLLVIGTFNGQGHPTCLHWYSSRTVIIVSLVTGFLIYSAYNAVVVRSLLSTPAPNIRNISDLMASDLKLAVENYHHFYKYIFKDKNMDDSTRKVYKEKIETPKGAGYKSVAEGFQGVLKQKWAMYAQVNNIQLEMAKATPGQVCRLAWMHVFFSSQINLCPILPKKSDLKHLISLGLLLARERGLNDRGKRRHHATPISCLVEHKRQWAPVKIQIVLSAVGVVFAGVVASGLLLIKELHTDNEKIPFIH